MGKKCVICEEPAKFCVKGTNDFYCPSCAEENFADIGMLQKIEEEAKVLKKLIDEKTGSLEKDLE